MRIVIFSLCLSSLLIACQGVEPQENDDYFDVLGLLDKQYELLKINTVSLTKEAIIDLDTAVTSFVPDTTQWKNELGIFRRLDINKPKWRGQYVISEAEDQFSNLTIRTYTTNNAEAEVKYLKLYYLANIADLRRIEASWQENNPVYTSERYLTLYFEDISNKIVLSAYEVRGSQKMMLQKKVPFSIKSMLDYQSLNLPQGF